jgi:hypothetical protein
MTFYNRDSTVPFWRSNVDVDALFENHAYRPERAQAWLRWRYVSESTAEFRQVVMMRGRFEFGLLGYHTYCWTFTPTYADELAIVFPVYEDYRLVDLLAISRHNHSVWGCVTGAGQYVGDFSNEGREDRTLPIIMHVHNTPCGWLMSNCNGILPLAKAFFPLMQFASSIVAQDAKHAWEIANETFIYPAERFGLDCNAAEQAAFDRISFDEAAV